MRTPLRSVSLPGLNSRQVPSLRRSGPSRSNPLVFDLLRQRRKQFGQQSITPLLADRQSLIVQGLIAGAGLFGIVLAFTALVFLRVQIIKAQMGDLVQVESQAESLRQQLAQNQKSLAATIQVNQQLTAALSNVRPSSALLSELQLRTPVGVQLVQADMTDSSTLKLRGLAEDPQAFARINALQLELRRSALFDANGVSLQKLERTPAAASDAARPVTGSGMVQFELVSRFAQLPPGPLQQLLLQLGSQGMAHRLELLQREGLLR